MSTFVRCSYVILNAYTGKEKKSKINDLSFYCDWLEKEKQIKPKVSRRKEIMKRKNRKKAKN